MPYQAYLTDTDRAIDRDANEMLTQRGGYEGAGYLAQGYANMDVLPEQMALADLLERRQRLSMNSRQGRAEQAKEDMALNDQSEFDGYSNFVRGIKDLPEQQRLEQIRSRLLSNPNEAINPLVGKANSTLLAGDQAVLDAKKNALETKRMQLEDRQIQFGLDTSDEDEELKKLSMKNALENGRLTQEKLGIARHELGKSVLSNVGKNIFGMDAFSAEERPMRDKLIKISSHLSTDDDPQSRESLLSLMDITGGIATGNRVKELRGHLMRENSSLIRNVFKSSNVNLAQLPEDPAERDAQLRIAEQAVLKKGSPEEVSAFKTYVDRLKSFNDSSTALVELKKDLFDSLERIDALRLNPDPVAKQQLKDELALLNAKGAFQAAHFEREFKQIEDEQKRRDKESQIAGREARAIASAKSADLGLRRLALAEYIAQRRDVRALAGDQFDRAKNAYKIKADGMEEALGLTSDASTDDIMKAFEELAPSVEPGIAPADY